MTGRLGTAAFTATCLISTLAGDALASEPVLPGEPRVMREPGEPVDVPDAADGSDPIDIDVGLSFRLDYERGAIQRVRGEATEDVATVTAVSSRLVPEIKIGMFHDLAAIVRLPILLSSTRSIDSGGGPYTVESGDVALFDVPFRSPERSGIENLTLGIAWGITNQARDAALPSITVVAEVEMAVGDAMRACVDPPPEGEVRCADAADPNRNGKRDAGELDARGETDTGTARGTVAIALGASVSRRVRYVEPFGTLRAKIEVPLDESPFKTTSLDKGETFPPVRGEAELGLGLVPWENRERFSRVWIDARISGGFVTRGPDYSPLFDAIGASDSQALRAPTETAAGRAYATGMTVSEAHGSLGARGSFVWRASELIELGLAAAIRHDLAHGIAADAKCLNGKADCAAVENPAYRAELDGPAGAFTLAESLDLQLAASGAVMF